MRDRDKPLLDVDVGRAVLSHRAQLDQVRLGGELLDREQDVDGADDVVVLGVDGPGAVDHRVGRGTLLAKVDDGVGLEGLEGCGQKLKVADVADQELDVFARDLSPGLDAVVRRGDRGQGLHAQLGVVAPTGEVVDDGDGVAPGREVERGGKAAVAVAA